MGGLARVLGISLPRVLHLDKGRGLHIYIVPESGQRGSCHYGRLCLETAVRLIARRLGNFVSNARSVVERASATAARLTHDNRKKTNRLPCINVAGSAYGVSSSMVKRSVLLVSSLCAGAIGVSRSYVRTLLSGNTEDIVFCSVNGALSEF